MTLEVIPIRDGDMEYVRANPFQEAVKSYPKLPIPEHTQTLLIDGNIVAVGGIRLFFEGVGEAWIIMAKQSLQDGIFGLRVCRAVADKLDSLAVEIGMRRVEAQVRADFPAGKRFAEILGFKFLCEREDWFPNGISSILYFKVYK